jgi:hypothetical protein
MKPQKVPVGERALLQRINRALPHLGVVKKSRGAQREFLGEFFRLQGAVLVEKHVKIDALARKLGVLKAWEVLCR